MSSDGPQFELLAIAFVVEASLSVSHEWNYLFKGYIAQLLQRCNITSSANKLVRVAFITYGTADTRPSPIIKRIHFTELRYIFQDIKDDNSRLGIGQIDSGSGGMAALEGFATTLDMFDGLRTVSPKDPDYRIVHIAACPPDSSEHPRWNTSPSLDSLTWEHLPAELKKRNIQLSGINISSDLPHFPELYMQATTGHQTTPWFNVKAQHHVHLNGFTSIQPQPKAKRAGEPVAAERTPETKRARVASTSAATEASPLNLLGQTPPSVHVAVATPPPASNSNASQPTNQRTSQTTPQPATQSAAPPAVQPQIRHQIMQQAQMIIAKRKQLDEEFKALNARKQSAMAQGNIDVSNHCDIEINKRREQLGRLNQALAALQQQARRVQSAPQNPNPQGQDAAQPVQAPPMARAVTSPGTVSKEPQTLNPNAATTPRQSSSMQSPSQNPQITPARSISTSGVPASTPNAGMGSPAGPPTQSVPASIPKAVPPSAGLSAQMQKLMDLNRNRTMPVGAGMSPSANAQAGAGMTSNETSVNANNGTAMNPTPQSQPQPQPQPQQSTMQSPSTNQGQSVPVWEGILSFNGTGSDGNKKEVRTGVSASSSNASNSHPETWPSTLTLLPAHTPAVSIPEFQDWIRRTKPVLCTFKARTPDDEANYLMLVSVMSSKKMYATASWSLPNGTVKENVLIFPINNIGLCGAFFPLGGIPEMPKAASPAPQVPPQIVALISQLPPEQRSNAIAQIRQKIAAGPEVANSFFRALMQRHLQQQQLQQQTAQNRAAMANQFGLNHGMAQMGTMSNSPNLMNFMGMNGMNTAGANPLAAMGNPSAILPNMARAGTGTGSGTSMNLNYDVLQSFMQRNNPDGNASGMGPG
ncbi:hypothetical protein P691DRAFT_772324 [Macrolepiota fuliginosa MF-IS2]|uniref:Mediator of RNA polymerase II transcription subunit 25 von Willebrand factor type A domain-containing protein n=1 Tax=Macrolepiota fuliginosa MF-IS2 TaxID=1400762 RepID=A0A9P5XK09_9AGAR|nr:hypothetical protein P691DRAFT_772324 [Macrolepiota fuliginosa MF-IS2]